MTTPIAGVHLDLKYIMPDPAYLIRWVKSLPALGINTLLIEYEDKFPYAAFPFISAPDALRPEALRDLLSTARNAGLRIVPLVQTLSHLEFALAHDPLAHLREAPEILTQVDTANPDARAFVETLLDEVLAYHEQDDWFHLGGDEIWHLGRNPGSAAQLKARGPIGLWAHHEQPLVQKILDAGKRPILWDDVFWNSPETVNTVDLPRKTILMSWGYSAHSAAQLGRVDVYREAGFDVLGAPCLNWGVMTPRHDHCLANVFAWGQKIKEAGGLGVINTAWSCFHVLPQAQDLYAAATSAAVIDPSRPVDRQWQVDTLAGLFGVVAPDVPDALETVGALWEHTIEDLPRPVTPVLHSYMDMVLLYRSAEQRRAEGIYPLDWDSMDLVEMMRKKLRLLGNEPGRQEVVDKLGHLVTAYGEAAEVLKRFVSDATIRREEAAYFAVSAHVKMLHARVMHALLTGQGDWGALRADWSAARTVLSDALSPFVRPDGIERLLKLWWCPTAEVLADRMANKIGMNDQTPS